MGNGSKEFILKPVCGFGLIARLAHLLIQTRGVHCTSSLTGEPHDEPLVTFGKDPRLWMAEKKTPENLAGLGTNRYSKVARYGQMLLLNR